MIQAVERLKLILKRLGDLVGHTFSTSAGIRHNHGNCGYIDIRQQIDRHRAIRQRPNHNDQQHDHRNEHWLFYRRIRDDHTVQLLGWRHELPQLSITGSDRYAYYWLCDLAPYTPTFKNLPKLQDKC